MRVGTAANEVSTNGMLGEMAFQDPQAVVIEGGLIAGKAVETLVDQQALAAARFGDPYSAIPTLDLSFVGGLQATVARERFTRAQVLAGFSNIITFTRASGAGRFNESGVYEWLEADQPRIDFDPVTGECRGLLVEESRTNLLTNSVNPIQQANTVLAAPEPRLPDHVGYSRAGAIDSAAVAMTAGTAYVASIFVRIDAVTTTGTVTASVSGVALGAAQVVTAADVGRLFRLSSGAHTPGTNISLRARATPTDGITISVFAAQIEAGSFPTSYIPTTSSQVTRAADVASVNTLSPWFNASEGTLFVEYSRQWESSPFQGRVAYLNNGLDTSRVIQIRSGGAGAALGTITDGGVINADIQSPTLPRSGAKVALSWSAAGASLAADGAMVGEDRAVVIPQGLTTLWLGNSFGNTQLLGHIRVLRYFPRRLSNAELQAITS